MLPKVTDYNGLGHDFIEPSDDCLHLGLFCVCIIEGRTLEIRHLFLQMIQPGHFITFVIHTAVIEVADVAAGAMRAGTAIHIAMKPLGRWAYATPVIHLGTAIGVDIAVIIVKLLLGTRDSQIG